ncbi:MAG: hypothetical protein WBW48_00370 [Anaerolineae bacterium]
MMAYIRRSQHALEITEFVAIPTFIVALVFIVSYILDPTVESFDTFINMTLGISICAGIVGFIIWVSCAFYRLYWEEFWSWLDGLKDNVAFFIVMVILSILLFTGILSTILILLVFATPIIDFNTRFLLSRFYKGEKPLVYGMFFKRGSMLSQIRSDQYLFEITESIIIGLVLVLFITSVAGGFPTAGLDTVAYAGLTPLFLWPWFALARTIFLNETRGCTFLLVLLLVTGIIMGFVLVAVIDLNTRYITKRFYQGDIPLRYGLFFRKPATSQV